MVKKQIRNNKNTNTNKSKDKTTTKQKGKKQNFNNNADQDQEDVEDLMAWGNQKQNYYKDDQSQYSSLSEEEEEANKIYENKYNELNLNDEQLYGIENQDEENNKLQELSENDQEDADEGISEEYILKQLQWALNKAKLINTYQINSISNCYEKLLQNYILAMISLKELKIPYIQHHPILQMIITIRSKIVMAQKKLTLCSINSNNESNGKAKKEQKLFLNGQNDKQIDSEQEDDGQELQQQGFASEDYEVDYCKQATNKQKSQHKKGMEYYNQLKKKTEQSKKLKKHIKKQQFIENAKSRPIFKQITETEGRFASELILKNKGLMKKRKKIQGNSRVKLRKKFQKKVALRRAQTGHFIRQNPGRQYQGESNIKYGKIAGVKLK